MVFDLLAFVAGIIYGYVNPGKEEKGKLLKKGLKIGVGVGIVFAVLNLFVGGFMSFGATLIGSIIGIGFLTLIFIAGTIIGDWLEHKIKK
jgi:Mg/Co/Ni transporter MgtE